MSTAGTLKQKITNFVRRGNYIARCLACNLAKSTQRTSHDWWGGWSCCRELWISGGYMHRCCTGLYIAPFTLGHINVSDINPIFNSRTIYWFNGIKICAAFYWSSAKMSKSKRVATTLVRSSRFFTFNEDDCVLSICDLLSLWFAIVCKLAWWIDAQLRRVAVASSYLAITWRIAYNNTLSHVYFFAFLGGVRFTYVVSTTRCTYTCPITENTWSEV